MTIVESSKLIELNFNQLKYLSIDNIFTIFLFILLRRTPRLKSLRVKLISHAGDLDARYMKHETFELTALTCLHIESYEITWQLINLHLLSHMPNLRRLTAIGDYKETVNNLANQWKESFLKYTPHLTNFRFHINIPLKYRSLDTDALLKPFHEEFWQERKWYAAIDIRKKMTVHLYSLPCPYFDRILEMKYSIQHQLTTLPSSCK